MPAKKKKLTEAEYNALSISEKVKHDYLNGSFSPLQLAYKHNIEISDVLIAIEQSEMLEVTIAGDQIDDAGPGATIKPFTKARVPYSKN